jgi:FixJ family two-component response regulator
MMDVGARVIVVEDDASMRRAIERLLSAAGFLTEVYTCAEDLLAAGPSNGDLCVITDLKLPAMSGFELLTELRRRGWPRPLILITAHDSAGVRQKAEKSGVAAYLAKPFLGTELVAAVRSAIGIKNAGAQ